MCRIRCFRQDSDEREKRRLSRMPSRQKLIQMLLEAQERLCGLCWCPLRNNIDTDHILPKAWHTKLGKPGKNRKDNLQATHENCNKQKGSYPNPWHRHTLRLCLALARGSALNTESFLKKLAGPGPAIQDQSLLQGPEQMHFRTAYGLTVPYICEYFSDQGLPVPARTRSDRFLQPFHEWLNTEPVQARIQSERADIYAEAPEMWNRAAAHVNRVPPGPYVSCTRRQVSGAAGQRGSARRGHGIRDTRRSSTRNA